jgi:hypothetical protein
MSTRPGQNPVTFKGRQSTSDSTKVGVALCRLDTEQPPQDGQNRVGRKNQTKRSVVLTTYAGEGDDVKVTQTVVIDEEHFVSGLLLLFPDILVEQGMVRVASMREFLFKPARPKIEGG